ncbi:cytochrome c-550 PedF [Tropicibacter oceani]|uniref:Cytochrome c-550 PedF n=1 Tax=Tropicibacter oceani TaxID=3058420 RepID=A0ABY8QDY4_9RHOB|nr:cytochrome c-550 PedF [Tropicibacter oceani]WGW02824.1 cytochrome c-550 PedF [Tropicibacter oceani]
MTKFTMTLALGALILAPALALAHGDVAPQAVDTAGLPENGDDWLSENPYRAETAGEEVWATAVKVGASGYNQNCARCHGLEVISGGLAPDLRFLEAEEYGDEWFIERFRDGYTQNGVTKMPAFGELLGQDAAWAIRTYVETRPDDASMEEVSDELKALRDELTAWAEDPAGADSDAVKGRLSEIAAGIETLSGAPVADSAASRAAVFIDGTQDGFRQAAEALTIGLSAAH